jgi:xanthine dehydrogenase large subunit
MALQQNDFNPFVGEELDVDFKLDTSNIFFSNGKVTDKKTKASIEFGELCSKAHLNRISISDYAFYKTPDLSFNKVTYKGNAFSYFTNAAAVSEVLIDKFTGDVKVLRSDLLVDLGRRINPGIDKGQVAGAFVQGMGWVTAEKLHYGANGSLISHSPTTYKIPSIQDTPREFNINFIENDKNQQNVYKSKAVGEPPFLLANSVWLAIKNAIYRESGKIPLLKSPATNEEVLMELMRLKQT